MTEPLPDMTTMSPRDFRWFRSGDYFLAIPTAMSTTLPRAPSQAEGESDSPGSNVLVPESEVPVMALHDSILLAEQDPLLRCLDVWLAKRLGNGSDVNPDSADVIDELDWSPSDVPDTPPALSIEATHGSPRRVSVSMPISDYQSLPEMPSDWAEFVACEKHVVELHIEIADIRLTADEADKIAAGSLVLLPGSFSERWQVSLRSLSPMTPATERSLVARDLLLAPAGAQLIFTINDQPSASPDSGDDHPAGEIDNHAHVESTARLRVAFDEKVWLNVLHLDHGGPGNRQYPLALGTPLQGSPVTLEMTQPGGDSNSQYWHGTLMPVGKGWGVLLADNEAQ